MILSPWQAISIFGLSVAMFQLQFGFEVGDCTLFVHICILSMFLPPFPPKVVPQSSEV
jgi:hypothetical protein